MAPNDATEMLKPLSAADAQRLCEFFREGQYTHQDLDNRRLPRDLHSRAPGELAPLVEGTKEPSLANLILRWFLLGLPAASEMAAGLVPPTVLAILLECGMLVHDGGCLSPAVMLSPWDQCLFASDTAARLESHSPDLVIWPNPTSRLLHQFTMRHPSRATLDLGAGCGIQAVFAAHHSALVTATDLNPRATRFARFNAWLNGAANMECLTGDTFEPVRDRRFDMIVANPPFFVTPSGAQMYCENGMELDGYCRRIVREAPAYLNEGGFLQMVCEWVQVRGQPWQDRLGEWLDTTGCDAWIFRSYARQAGAYARGRIRTATADADAATLARWMDYYAQRGVEEVHGGTLAMRRRSGRNWVRIEEMPRDPNQPFGEAVSQAFASIDLLALHGSDEELLGAHLKLSPDTQLDQQMRQSDGRWQTVGTSLRCSAGIPASMRLDPSVAEFVAGLDGRQTLGELIGNLARQVRAEPEVVRRECLAVARTLFARRFVLP
jgi:methylase of polypeptide subunit release factors